MAEKHKSKYKAPKDLEKSQKPKTRKDLKDYTTDDKDGGLNPKSTKEKQLNVLRKTDKAVQDDGKMFPKYKDDDRLYKDIEDGDYDPKTAAKRLKKRQDAEEKDVKDVLKDKIENLTREQKERLVREYVRRKIVKVLREQEETEETPAPEAEAPMDAAAPTDTAAPAPDAAAPAPDASAPAPDMSAPAPTPDMAAPTDTATPAPDAAAPAPAPDATAAPAATAPAETPAVSVDAKELEQLNQGGTVTKVKKLNSILDKLMQDSDVNDQRSFYQLLARLSIKKMRSIQHKK